MNKQIKVWLVVIDCLVSSCIAAWFCGSKAATLTMRRARKLRRALASLTAGATGTVTGVIAFNGTPPAPKKIDTSADPVCGQKNPNLSTEDTVVKDGKLANVFVYIKDGTTADGKKIGDYTWQRRRLRSRSIRTVPLQAARDGHPGQSEAEHYQQRSDAAQYSPDAEDQSGVEPDAGERCAAN